jgi:PII-like signaling protein
MQGCQVTFFTQEGRRYHGKQLSHWLMQVMHEMPVRGATRLVEAEGLGHDHRPAHSPEQRIGQCLPAS